MKYLLYLAPVLIFIAVTTFRQCNIDEFGSLSNPIKITFTPSVDAQSISNNAEKLIDFLEKETGYYFTATFPTSYIAVVESFGSAKADVAIVNTFSYLLAQQKFGAVARLRIIRHEGETTYRGQIVYNVDSGIEKLEDLNGKRIAYVAPSSTSGYILPHALLEKNNIKPSEIIFANNHDIVISQVYQGQVDAGATYYSPPDTKTGVFRDARERVVTQYPDVADKVKILTLTDEIPNDPVIFRAGMPEDMMDDIVNALLKFVATPDGQEALYQIYSVRGLTPTKDSDYDVLREMLRQIGVDLEESVKETDKKSKK